MKEDGSFYKGKVRQCTLDHRQIGMGMDEETGYDAARKAAMVLTANILCRGCDAVSFVAEVPDLSKIRIVKE